MSSRILVGLSGGVDSSVAAALLARAGHEVIGVSLQLYDHSDGGKATRCCSPEDFLDARRVAAQVGFRYYVINQEEAFRREVLEDFARAYRAGRTPNPCVRCNAEVKFEALVKLADELGAEAVATGHYARLGVDPATGGRTLHRGLDRDKDQSYFLFDLEPAHRRRALFPLGEMTKAEVRREAASLGLATMGKPESQDVCFLEGGDYRRFLARQGNGHAEAGGEMVDTQGRVLSRHDGISHYTVGQRRGLGISSARRLYVLRVEPATRRVVVGPEEGLACAGLTVSGLRLDAAAAGQGPFDAVVQVRSRHAGAAALVTPVLVGDAADAGDTAAGATVEFLEPVAGVSPGQAAVFYRGDRVLGGGWIESTWPAVAHPAATRPEARP
jgi:tRNA-specific 2-thiouridylase